MTDWTDWLGDTDLTSEQRARFDRHADDLAGRYDDPEESDAALSALLQLILGETGEADLIEAWSAARRQVRTTKAAMDAALTLASESESELAIAARLGLARMTVRKALGK